MNADYYFELGLALKDQGQWADAAESFRQALRINPADASGHNNLGNILRNQGNLADALDCYRQALSIDPTHANAHNNLGIALALQGRLSEAAASFRQALAINPEFVGALSNLGLALKDQGNLADAIACFREALRLEPSHANTHNNLGFALRNQGSLAEAVCSYREALRLNPAHAEAHNNLGNALTGMGQLGEAGACYEQALRLKLDFPLARANRALLRLLAGDFVGGWPEYEYRSALPGFIGRQLPGSRWDGAPLDGKTILLYAEQGLGDTLQFIRYAPLVKSCGGTVLFECQPALGQLLEGVAGIDELITTGSPLPPFDCYMPLLSLPGIFKTTLTTIPADIPYVRAKPNFVERWRQELQLRAGRKIGIVWQGSYVHRDDRNRSVPLTCFAPLAALPGVSLVSLQVGSSTEQLASAPFPITDLGNRFDPASMEDLAGALMSLDLVVTVDTAVAHLAGALGVPVWVALPYVPDWRWLLDRDDSPWYPTLRLFRQRRLGDWTELFERIAQELDRLLTGRNSLLQN